MEKKRKVQTRKIQKRKGKKTKGGFLPIYIWAPVAALGLGALYKMGSSISKNESSQFGEN
jgi:hypothetical protein